MKRRKIVFDMFLVPPAAKTQGPELRTSPLHEYPAWCIGTDVPGGSTLAAKLAQVTLAAAQAPNTKGQVAGLQALLGFTHYLPVEVVAVLARSVRDESTALWSARLAVRWAVVRMAPGEERWTVQRVLCWRGAALGVRDARYWKLVGLL